MDLGDAYRELGLLRDASAETVRRTYLRLIKVHRPESDADRFMRVREAYECIQTWLRFRAALPPGIELAEEGFTDAPGATDAIVIRVPATVVEQPKAGEPEAGETKVAPLESPVARAQSLQVLFQSGAYRAAASELVAMLDANPEGIPSPLFAMHLVLQCFATGHVSAAVELVNALQRFVQRYGVETSFSATTAAAWAIIRELARPPQLDANILRIIASGMIEGKVALAQVALAELREKNPTAAARARQLLQAGGVPRLNASYLAALSPPPPKRRSGTPFASPWSLPLFVITMGILRSCATCASTTGDRRAGLPPPTYAPAAVATVEQREPKKEALARKFVEAWRASGHVQEVAERCGKPDVVQAAVKAQNQLYQGRCPADDQTAGVMAGAMTNACLADAVTAYFNACAAACNALPLVEEPR